MLNRALRLLRTFHQLSQTELAKRLKISNSYLSERETGNKNPGLDLLEKYALIFNIPVSSILLFSEKLNGDRSSEKIRVKAAGKILRILEWVGEKETVADGH